jgi:hypothetical protein
MQTVEGASVLAALRVKHAVKRIIIEQKQQVAAPIRTGRLKRNQDFLKEKTSRAQSLYFAQGASIRHEKPNGARHADLQEPLSQTNHLIREKHA